MLSVQEALTKIREQIVPLAPEAWPLGTDLLGLQLAADVASDLDMPPFDKAMMDGFAVRSADLKGGSRELDIVEEVSAGRTPREAVGSGQATRIMTGAPMPAGADAVIMIERCRLLENNRVRVDEQSVKPEQNILRRGREMRLGETILKAGARLRPQEIGLLAAVGQTSISVRPPARVAVLSTGDELVSPEEFPGPGQIRNSNAATMLAQAHRTGAKATYQGIAKDRLESLRALVALGLSADVLVLSGGVSAGKLDLVPGVLEEMGVEPIFHKVAIKPGKPVFFGVRKNGDARTYVFGLPGNPVAALVCFELFVRPAIVGIMGYAAEPRSVKAALAEDFPYKTDRPTYHPAWLIEDEVTRRVRPVPWFGSPDLRGVTSANCFVVFPVGEHLHKAGTVFDVLQME